MTPYELSLRVDEYSKMKETEMKDGIFLAYLNAYLHRVEKMPPLKKFIGDPGTKKTKKTMSDEKLLAQVRALNAQLGGKEVIAQRQESSE